MRRRRSISAQHVNADWKWSTGRRGDFLSCSSSRTAHKQEINHRHVFVSVLFSVWTAKLMEPSSHLQAAFKPDHREEVAARPRPTPPLHPTDITRITTYRRLLAGRGVSVGMLRPSLCGRIIWPDTAEGESAPEQHMTRRQNQTPS